MLIRSICPLFLMLFANLLRAGCLSENDLAVFNFTSVHDFLQNSSSQICQSIYIMYGQCATTDSVIKAYETFKLRFTENSLQKLGVVVADIKKIADRVDRILTKADLAISVLQSASTDLTNSNRPSGILSGLSSNSNSAKTDASDNASKNKITNGNADKENSGQQNQQTDSTIPDVITTSDGTMPTSNPGNGNGNRSNTINSNPSGKMSNSNPSSNFNSNQSKNGNSSNTTLTMSNDTSAKDAKRNLSEIKVVLDSAVYTKLKTFKAKTNDLVEFAKPIVEDSLRHKCYEAQFKLLGASLCILSSGNADNFIKRDSNGQISTIIVKCDSVNEVITQCSGMLLTFCELSNLKKTLAEPLATNTTISDSPKAESSFCSNNTELKSCVENITKCPLNIKQAIMAQAFAPFTFKLIDDSETTQIVQEADILADAVEPAVIITSRRLASTPSAITYQAEVKGIDLPLATRNCNLSEKTIEEKVSTFVVNLAEALTNSSQLKSFLAMLNLAFFAYLL